MNIMYEYLWIFLSMWTLWMWFDDNHPQLCRKVKFDNGRVVVLNPCKKVSKGCLGDTMKFCKYQLETSTNDIEGCDTIQVQSPIPLHIPPSISGVVQIPAHDWMKCKTLDEWAYFWIRK